MSDSSVEFCLTGSEDMDRNVREYVPELHLIHYAEAVSMEVVFMSVNVSICSRSMC